MKAGRLKYIRFVAMPAWRIPKVAIGKKWLTGNQVPRPVEYWSSKLTAIATRLAWKVKQMDGDARLRYRERKLVRI